MAVLAGAALLGFLVRELTAEEPILDLRVYEDRNFAAASFIMAVMMFGFYSSMVLLALYTQKVLGYDAWTAGMVLAPGGVGNMLSLVLAGRLIYRMDQRFILAVGCVLNATAAYSMATLTLGMDYWSLAWPRFLQGVGVGLVFVPLNMVALATIPREKMGNATALVNVVRNLGGAVGVAVSTMLLARRSQLHQTTLVSHVDLWDSDTTERLAGWTEHFRAHGADIFTAKKQALGMLYHEVQRQAQVMAFADDFWLLFLLFCTSLFLLPMLRRVRLNPVQRRDPDAAPAPVHAE
jgi:DHA2 family multidrug resistance protein